MDLTKITNKESTSKVLTLNTSEFDELSTFITSKDKDMLPADDSELNNQINNMLNRWGIFPGKDRDDLQKLCVKLYYGRLTDKKSRTFWGLLRENSSDIMK